MAPTQKAEDEAVGVSQCPVGIVFVTVVVFVTCLRESNQFINVSIAPHTHIAPGLERAWYHALLTARAQKATVLYPV